MFTFGDEVRLTSRKDFEGSTAIIQGEEKGIYAICHKNVKHLRDWNHLENKTTRGWRASQFELVSTIPDETEAFFV